MLRRKVKEKKLWLLEISLTVFALTFSLDGAAPSVRKLMGWSSRDGREGAIDIFPRFTPSAATSRGRFWILWGDWHPNLPGLGGTFIFMGEIPRPAPLARTLVMNIKTPHNLATTKLTAPPLHHCKSKSFLWINYPHNICTSKRAKRSVRQDLYPISKLNIHSISLHLHSIKYLQRINGSFSRA